MGLIAMVKNEDKIKYNRDWFKMNDLKNEWHDWKVHWDIGKQLKLLG